jgi:hypothetical protein
MRELGLPVYPRDMNVQQYYVSQQQAMGPLDAAQDSLSPESKVLDSRPPEDKAQDSRSSGVKVQAPPNTTHDSLPPFPQDTNARTLVRRFLTVLSILQGEQRELNTNTARGVILISNLKRLEDEVRYVDEARGHAEKNDLMNAAAHTTARLEGKNDTSRHDTFSIIKAHRYPDQKFMALIHAIPEIEVRFILIPCFFLALCPFTILFFFLGAETFGVHLSQEDAVGPSPHAWLLCLRKPWFGRGVKDTGMYVNLV